MAFSIVSIRNSMANRLRYTICLIAGTLVVASCGAEEVKGTNCLSDIYFVQSSKLLKQSENAIEAGAYAAAISSAKSGISVLEGRYLSEGSIDDSGLKIGLAGEAERDGDLSLAAKMLMGVLRDRANRYQANCREIP